MDNDTDCWHYSTAGWAQGAKPDILTGNTTPDATGRQNGWQRLVHLTPTGDAHAVGHGLPEAELWHRDGVFVVQWTDTGPGADFVIADVPSLFKIVGDMRDLFQMLAMFPTTGAPGAIEAP